jgi:hypothetical protein
LLLRERVPLVHVFNYTPPGRLPIECRAVMKVAGLQVLRDAQQDYFPSLTPANRRS